MQPIGMVETDCSESASNWIGSIRARNMD